MKNLSYCFILLNVLGILWSTSSCDRQANTQPNIYFSDELLSYTDFSEGSYWVYEDSASHEVDTIKSSQKERKLMSSNGEGCQMDYLRELQSSSFYGKNALVGGNTECTGEQVLFMEIVPVLFMNNTQYVQGARETIIGNTFGESKYLEKCDSLNIMGATYYQVKIYRNSTGIGFIGRTIYWAKNVGVIRRETADGKIWLLIAYHHN